MIICSRPDALWLMMTYISALRHYTWSYIWFSHALWDRRPFIRAETMYYNCLRRDWSSIKYRHDCGCTSIARCTYIMLLCRISTSLPSVNIITYPTAHWIRSESRTNPGAPDKFCRRYYVLNRSYACWDFQAHKVSLCWLHVISRTVFQWQSYLKASEE